MKILVSGQHFWPENFHVNDLCAGLVERGHDVTMLTGKPNYPQGKLYDGYGIFSHNKDTYRGVKVVRVPLIPRGSGKKLALLANYISFVLFGWIKAGRLARKGKFDLVLVYQTSPIFMALPGVRAARVGKVPLAMLVLDVWPDTLKAVGIHNEHIYQWTAAQVRKIYSHCSRILISSKGFEERVRAMGYKGRIHFMPQWVIPTPRDEDARADMPHQGLNILFAGNVGEAQGLEVVIEAAALLREAHSDIHFTILGDGRNRKHLIDLTEKRGLLGTIHFPGRCSGSQVPAWLDSADCALICLRKDELFARTLPAKMQGYLRHGIPILASMDGEGAQVVEEAQAGFAAPAGDARALCEIILRMQDTTIVQRQDMAAHGRAYYAAHYEREKMLDQYEVLLQDLVKQYQ